MKSTFECPLCGNEVGAQEEYCPECGETLASKMSKIFHTVYDWWLKDNVLAQCAKFLIMLKNHLSFADTEANAFIPPVSDSWFLTNK